MNELRDALRELTKTGDKVYSSLATVIAVDKSARLCDVELVGTEDLDGNRVSITDVMLQIDPVNAILILPTIGSTVAISYISMSTAYVSMFSQIDLVTLNGENLGGITKTLELKAQLNKLNAQLQAVISALSWTPVPNDGGAALNAAFAAAISGKIQADFSSIENNTVMHGDGSQT